ncbi:MAG: hypothetical protein MJZ59_01810, partial [Paludibacteraceae bacterium]|nr:hypothetical protein [Paludibacteraceae bacterium]
MKKLFSFIMVALMSIMTLNAETTRIYCKMAQNWWKVDNAAVGCHSWGTPGPGTDWPGVRMTPVENETDMWYIDLDVTKVQNVIFTRVNPSGNIADWGAKTKDLTIPTNGDNLFTITTSDESWGNPGCDGEWSKYGEPVETKYYAKNNWNGAAAQDWSWLEMSATNQENVYMLDSVVFGGTGVNINTKTEDTDALWFAADAITVLDGLDGLPGPIPPDPRKRDTIIYAPARTNAPLEAPQLQAGDTIKLFFNAADSTLSAAIVGRPAPAARKEFVFVAGEAAEANPALFAITWGKDGSNETVKLANKADDIYTAEILETVDSLVLVRCASDATEIIWDGEGKNVWNQTANYELCDTMYFESWVEETNLFAITCDTPQPVETKYYAKNNWNGGEWSWKEMTQFKETVYTLDSVVFGGTGININTKEDDTDALWFAAEDIILSKGLVPPTPHPINTDSMPRWAPARMGAGLEAPTLLAGDTIKLFFNAADSTLRAAIYGRPEPAARKEFVFVAGEAAEANPAMFAITWGKDGSNETVKMTQKGEEALYTANILETVDSLVLVRCASDATEIIWDGEGKNVWNQTANYELCDTMSFVAWVEETNLFTITCDTPQPVETKYYAKNNWNGGEW